VNRDARPTQISRLRRAAVALGALVVFGSAVIAVAPAVAPAVASSATRTPTVATAPFAAPTGVTLTDTAPPWPLPADATPSIAAAGLSVLNAEQLAVHYHVHLDIIANGAEVTVPAGVGFVLDHGTPTGITVLHTHDTSGVVHIESAAPKRYALGQFFTEWGVVLDSTQLGGLHTDDAHVLQTYVNGHRFTGDPGTIRLKRHLEIALWYGPAGQKPVVPKTYHFPAGL
jgi:hypothetical protein